MNPRYVYHLMVGVMAVTLTSSQAWAASPPVYRVVHTVALGSPDNWDYVSFDEATHRVYVGHGTKLAVIDDQTGTLVGQVEGMGLAAAQGVAIRPDLGKGYVASGDSGQLISFDLNSLKPVGAIAAAEDADLVINDPATRNLFVVNGHSKTITIIDPRANKQVGVIELGGSTQGGATDGKGKLFINVAGKGEIVRVDTVSGKVDARWPLQDCPNPRGLGFDAAAGRLFASCTNAKMDVIDSRDGHAIATLPIGKLSDGGGYDPIHHRAFSSNSEGTLSVISDVDPDRPVSLGEVQTAPGARTMAVDPTTGRVYLVTADVEKTKPAVTAGKAPAFDFVPGTVKLLMLDPD